jgi:AAA domain
MKSQNPETPQTVPLPEPSPIQIPEPKPVSSLNGLPIVRGKQITPLKGLIYGYNGVGKSTFAAAAKKPVFLDLESNIDHLDIDKIPLSTLEEVEECLKNLLSQPHDYATVIIDSIDKLDILITKYVRQIKNKKELDYGRLYVFIAEHFESILAQLDKLREQRKMNVILIGHSTIKRCENPTTQVYDKYVLRVHEKTADIICDWSHFILFAVNDLSFEEGEDLGFNKTRERVRMNDRRVVYTMGNTAYVAKNPYNLPRTIPLEWNAFITGVKNYYATITQEGEK